MADGSHGSTTAVTAVVKRRKPLSPNAAQAVQASYDDALDYALRLGDHPDDAARFARRYAGLARWAITNNRDLKSVADFRAEVSG